MNGGIHGMRFGYHRLVARRFPYAVYYRVAGNEVVVHRVLDCRRDPSWIRRALKNQTGEGFQPIGPFKGEKILR